MLSEYPSIATGREIKTDSKSGPVGSHTQTGRCGGNQSGSSAQPGRELMFSWVGGSELPLLRLSGTCHVCHPPAVAAVVSMF